MKGKKAQKTKPGSFTVESAVYPNTDPRNTRDLFNEILERLESLERRCDWYDNNCPWNRTAR